MWRCYVEHCDATVTIDQEKNCLFWATLVPNGKDAL